MTDMERVLLNFILQQTRTIETLLLFQNDSAEVLALRHSNRDARNLATFLLHEDAKK